MIEGRFVTLEGGEGAGKSTQIELLAKRLRDLGRTVIVTREPGGTPLGRQLRGLLVRRSDDPPGALAELFLYAADRAHHVHSVVRPALEKGVTVLCDRYADATEAYQGWGRGIDGKTVRLLNELATGGVAPHRTVILDLPPEQGVARSLVRNDLSDLAAEIRFETEELRFHRLVREGYLAIARRERDRVRVIDAGGGVEEVAASLWTEVEDLFTSGR